MTLVDEEARTRVITHAAHLEPRPPRRWPVVVGAVAVAAVLVIALFGRDHEKASPNAHTPLSSSTAFAHTTDGAKRAAVSYAAAYGSADMFDATKRHRILRAIADPSVEWELQSRLDAAFGAVMATFGLDAQGEAPPGQALVVRTIPVGVHLEQYDGSTAQIAVWSTGMIGLTGASSSKPVTEAWSTATLTLRWVNNDWKWVTFTQVDGPTPVSGTQAASGGDAIATAAREFGEPTYAR